MRKFGNRALALLLAAMLLLAGLPLSALAAQTETLLETREGVYYLADGSGGCMVLMTSVEETKSGNALSSAAAVYAAAETGADDGTMYSQLNDRQKACYEALDAITLDDILSAPSVRGVDGQIYRRVRVYQVKGITELSLKGSSVGGTFVTDPSEASKEVGVMTDLCVAIEAVRYDRPASIWMSQINYGYKLETQSSPNAANITYVTFDFLLNYSGKEKAMHELMLEKAKEIAAEAEKEADTYHMVLYVHNAIIAGNTYSKIDQPLSHSAYSALITDDEFDPVCDGYSKAFKIVLDLLKIPCAIPSSATHMWNNVKMDDGEWYNVDLTWDDNDSETGKTDYFLVGSQTEFNGQAFSQQTDHLEENPYEVQQKKYPTRLDPYSLTFPTKNKKSYEYIGKDYGPLSFPDVRRSAWYYSAVESAVGMGLFTGDSSGNFLPGNNITRGQFALVMAKAMNVDLSTYTASTFTDVPKGKWYSAAAAWAQASGLMVGSGGRFRPNDPITRQEMCVVLTNALGSNAAPDGTAFPDDKAIAKWARTAVYQCKALGLVQGDNKGNFAPKGNTQRSAAAVVFTKFAELRGAAAEEDPEETPEETPDDGVEEGTP